jgi:glycosyltransferase involved in cell wall biosynthesis
MRVTFIGDNYFKHEPYTTELNQLGVEVLYGGYYLKNWQNWLKENGGFFDYIYLERAHIAIKYIDYARCYSNAKIIYFNVDMQHIREYREYEITGDKIHLERGKAAEKIEMELSSKADVLHVVGSYEQGILQNIFPNKPIRNIPVYIYEEQKKDVRSPKDRRDLLFVGGFSHQPNVDGVMWFYSEVFPIILDSLPNIKWHIVGSNVPEKIKAFESNNIICHGFVSDEELTELYNTCKVCVAPLRFGAGVKGKVVEAIYNRIPLITTPIGSEGLSTKEKAFYVAEGAEEFAETVKKLYLDDTSCLKLQENCLKFIKNHFTIEIAKKEVLKDIKI